MKSLCLAGALFVSACRADAAEDSLKYGPFGTVRLYHTSHRPTEVVLFISGDGGWNLGVIDMARNLATLDAAVAGIDITRYLRALESSRQKCLYPAGDLENLSKAVQQHLNFDTYTRPVLVGYSSGATLAYAVLAQSPSNTFKGAISLGFCPDLPLTRPLCHGDGLDWEPGPGGKGYSFKPSSRLEVPWVALQGEIDQVCNASNTKRFVSQVARGEIVLLPKVGHGFAVQRNWMPQFKAAFSKIVATTTGEEGSIPAPHELGDLPVTPLPAAKATSGLLAILLSGDGGWGETERGISRDLAENGVDVVGWNSLHYYWKKRTPEEASKDLERITRHYLSSWHKDRLALIGYSFGADVLPFLINRLPTDLRSAISAIVLIGPSRHAEFEFHLADWFGKKAKGPDYPTEPEIAKLGNAKIFCFYGSDDSDAVCSDLDPLRVTSIKLSGGHRVRGNFAPISDVLLDRAK